MASSLAIVYLSVCRPQRADQVLDDMNPNIRICQQNPIQKLFPSFFGTAAAATTIVTSMMNFMLPNVFSIIGGFERYSNPANQSIIQLARSFLLKLVSIYVIMSSNLIVSNWDFNLLSSQACWETSIGQSFYQLVWIDFVVDVTSTLAYGFGVKYVFGKSYYDFNLSYHTLDIIYKQAVIWYTLQCLFSCSNLGWELCIVRF